MVFTGGRSVGRGIQLVQNINKLCLKAALFFRFLVNNDRVVPITIVDSSKNRTKLSLDSNEKGQKKIPKGSGDVIVDGQTVLKDFKFRAGAVYTINVCNDSNSMYVSNYT